MLEKIIEIGGIRIPLVEIQGGRIELNDDRIQQKWQVEIEPFFLGKYLVTQALYKLIVGESPSYFEGKHLPIESVSWYEAAHFCNELSRKLELENCYHFGEEKIAFDKHKNGFRLPLESEWQFACQANEGKIRYGELESIAWYKGNSGGETRIVGLKEPNPWGLYDMLGNVWEWCSDVYDEDVYGTYRIFRGGGWSDEARSVMATTRRRSHPTKFRIEDLGFRIALNAKK